MSYEYSKQQLNEQKFLVKKSIQDIEANIHPIKHIHKGRLSVDISTLRDIWRNLKILEDLITEQQDSLEQKELQEILDNWDVSQSTKKT